MAKHTWALLNESQDKAKKIYYKCNICDAIYILKQGDCFYEDGECSTTNLRVYPKQFNTKNFSGIIISNYAINYYKNGEIHRDDGPAIIYISTTEFNDDDVCTKPEYWFNNKHIEGVESVEEAMVKNLLE